MPGASAATHSSRCGRSPNDPSRVSATMRDTPVFSANTPNGRRTLSVMDVGGTLGLWLRCRSGSCLFLRFVNRPDHVERALRVVFGFIAQDSLTAAERVLEADERSLEAGELLGREEWLGKKTLQPAGAGDHGPVLRRQLLEAEHGNDVLE